METWLYYGLIAAVFLGISGFFAKVAASGKEGVSLQPHVVGIFVAAGILLVLASYYLIESKGNYFIPPNNVAILAAIASGATFGLGIAIVYKAYGLGANASQMVPFYNTNTLITVGLAILLLHELPSQEQMIRVLAGAALIVVGAFLVV
jgi:uncharacterized membrane protein